MKKHIVLLAALLLCTALLTGCFCEHEWVDATCLAAKHCSLCEKTEGEPLAHQWVDATCTDAKTCTLCGGTEGEPLGHTWKDATCTTVKICTVCNAMEGEPLGHSYELIETQEATCAKKGVELYECTVCGKEKRETLEKLEHDFEVTTNKCVTTTTCKNCEYKTSSETHDWYFSSTYHIDQCNYSKLTFYGTVTCRGCYKTKEGSVKYSAADFEKTFCAWMDSNGTGNYKEFARYPDEYDYVTKFTGYILQDCGDGWYRMSTKGRYDDVIMVKFIGTSKGRILEGDRVSVYGECDGLYTYTSVQGAEITIPKFEAYYIKIH